MKNPRSKKRIWNRKTTIILASTVPLLAVTMMPTPARTQVLPNTKMMCPASSTAIPFNSWFSGGTPALNAAVTPADSVNFSNNPNEDFYRWSYRMFLWLTSPTPATYGGTGRVFSSPEFYNVSPPDPITGMRTLTRNASNPFIHLNPMEAAERIAAKPPEPLSLGLRVANLGPHGFPFIKTKEGEFLEVLPVKISKGGRLLILNAQNKEVEVSQVQRSRAGEVQFLDTKGKAISRPQLQLHLRAKNILGIETVKTPAVPEFKFAFKIDPSLFRGANFKRPIFVLPSGAVIDPEVGQSDGNVQMTQQGSLIYYAIVVNDVYAYYLTGQKGGQISGNQFPISAADLSALQTFATAHGHTFLNPNALAIEIKTSWVDAATLPNNANDYITMMAKVPKYNTANAEHWSQNGTKTIRVALLGMHVVGSANGHRELIWSTFEHVGDTPNVSYAFTDPSNATQTQAADPIGSGSSWLFCGATTPTTSFVAQASAGSSTTIDSIFSGTPVQGTSVMRLAPWGAPNNFAPNPLVSVAGSNTQIISLNNDVRAQMNSADVRLKYLFLGATWTEGGVGASTNYHGQSGFVPALVVGTNHLAGSTMETFTQSAVWVNGNFPGPGCLSCHASATVHVSHIYGNTKPLF